MVMARLAAGARARPAVRATVASWAPRNTQVAVRAVAARSGDRIDGTKAIAIDWVWRVDGMNKVHREW
jgi:hypothetical protein